MQVAHTQTAGPGERQPFASGDAAQLSRQDLNPQSPSPEPPPLNTE